MKADLEQINKQWWIGGKILIYLFLFQKYCTAIHLALNKEGNQVKLFTTNSLKKVVS